MTITITETGALPKAIPRAGLSQDPRESSSDCDSEVRILAEEAARFAYFN